MDVKAFLSACLTKVLEMKGQDLFLKVGSVPRTRIGGVVKIMPFEVMKEEDTAAIVEQLLNAKQKERLARNLSVDFAFTLEGQSQRFRANVFFSRGLIHS